MQSLHVFVILSHDLRKILGYEIVDAPTGEWAAERVVEAFDIESSLTMVLRNQDKISAMISMRRWTMLGFGSVYPPIVVRGKMDMSNE